MEHTVPFTRRDFDRLSQAKRKLTEAVEMMDKAEGCGVDCQAFRSIHEYMSGQLGAIEREFMTPAPK